MSRKSSPANIYRRDIFPAQKENPATKAGFFANRFK